MHRPAWGLGNSEPALRNIRSMRTLSDSVDFFAHRPANHRLSEREPNEAYALAAGDQSFLLYFPRKGTVRLEAPVGRYTLRWLPLGSGQWTGSDKVVLPAAITTPSDGAWAARLEKSD